MPMDKLANMDERLWILEDLNMMYIRQIALSLQVKPAAPRAPELLTVCWHHVFKPQSCWRFQQEIMISTLSLILSGFHVRESVRGSPRLWEVRGVG